MFTHSFSQTSSRVSIKQLSYLGVIANEGATRVNYSITHKTESEKSNCFSTSLVVVQNLI